MNKILEILKIRKMLIILLIIVVVLFILIAFVFGKVTTPNINKGGVPLGPGEKWNQIVPGESTKEDVIKQFGEPISSTENSLSYKSSSPARDNQITIADNHVDLVRQMITPADKITTKTLTQKYGISSDLLYGPDSPNGIYLFIYANKGVAYLGNPNTESVIEVWYYPPTTLEKFRSKYALEYSPTYNSSF